MLAPRLKRTVLRPRFLLGIYALLTVVVSLQHYFKGTYNNYLIFVKPFFNLIAGKNLYLDYPQYYYDTYKYSPVFALFMGPFALLPDWLGLLAWNVLNNAVLFTAARRLFPDTRRQALFLLLMLVDMMTALHNSQANCLLVGLMLWVYINLENGKYNWAALCVALAALIKIYGVGIGLIFLFYPLPVRNGALAFLWLVLLALSPLLVVSWAEYQMQYHEWYLMVRKSATVIQLSLMGVLEMWTGLAPTARGLVQGLGMALLLAPLAYWRAWREANYRALYVASIPIFVVIFNQMAESPTYVIAVAGFMFWFLLFRRSTPLGWVLFALVVLVTTLSATDLYPRFVRQQFFEAHRLKAVPMIVAWLFIQSQLLFYPRWRARLQAAATASATEGETPELA